MNPVLPSPRGETWRRVGYIALVIAAVVCFFWALLPIGSTSLLNYALSRFSFAAIVFGWLGYVIVQAWHASIGARRAALAAGPRTYSVPRRFGIATLFLITLAFGMLSA